ncbi:MAG: hypothetical protein C4527_17065 [Candidatus Omnitrophota bacterium]|jgi:hypothetical protein|nr:MAG: hypothetical protein C4527_17065 [Candidatus Omnitrophota bacterium]
MNRKNSLVFHLVLFHVLWLPVLPSADDSQRAETVNEVTPSVFFGSMKVSGSLHSTFSFRSYDGRDDSDLYEYFSLRLKDVVKDKVDAAFSMSWHEDLNGSSRRAGEYYDPFLDLDTSADIRFRYYTGYVDVKAVGFEDSRLRLGRQYLDEIDYAHFDGATYRFSPIDFLDITLFGGRPITYYSSTSADAIYGTNVEYQITPQTKSAVRYYRYDADSFRDDLAAVELWHMFTPEQQAHVEFSLLDGEPYQLQTDYYGRSDSMDLDVTVQVIRLFDSIGDHTINFNPYFPLLYDYEPFTYGALNLTKGLGTYVALVGGFDIREADSIGNPVSAHTNRDFVRGTAGIELYPIDQLTLSVNGEFWDVDPSDEFTGVSGEVEYRPSKQWTLTAGAEYGEYVQKYRDEFLFLFGQDVVFRISPDVVTYYSRIRWKPTKNIYTAATFEFEDSDFDEDNWYSFRIQLGVHF